MPQASKKKIAKALPTATVKPTSTPNIYILMLGSFFLPQGVCNFCCPSQGKRPVSKRNHMLMKLATEPGLDHLLESILLTHQFMFFGEKLLLNSMSRIPYCRSVGKNIYSKFSKEILSVLAPET